jgi:hypothetical protein
MVKDALEHRTEKWNPVFGYSGDPGQMRQAIPVAFSSSCACFGMAPAIPRRFYRCSGQPI